MKFTIIFVILSEIDWVSTAVTVCCNLPLFTAKNKIFVEVRKGFNALS